MTGSIFSTMLRTTALGAAAALGLAASTQAQPYDNDNDAGYGGSAYAGGVVVQAPGYRTAPTFSGAPVVWARASRVVDISDLDLSRRSGVRVLRARVERAAADACDQLDGLWTQGLYPMGDPSDADCFHRAVDRAMASAPITYAAYRY